MGRGGWLIPRGLLILTWHYMARCATSVQKVVAQDKLNWGFSTTKITPNSTAHLTNFAVKWYSWLARDTRLSSEGFRFGIPFGNWSVRNGRGPSLLPPNFLFNGIWRALEADPQGGARKIPTTLGMFSQLIKSSSPSGVVKSAMITVDIAFFERTLSTPKLLRRPSCFNEAVTRDEPAKISTMRQSSKLAPLLAMSKTRSNRQGFRFLSWSRKLWGAWQPFFIHKCHPRLHSVPCAASWHLLRLKLKHSLRLWSSVPTHPLFCNSAGKMFATFFPFPFPLPFPLEPLW